MIRLLTTRTFLFFACAAWLFALSSCTTSTPANPSKSSSAATKSANSTSKQLHALFDDEWQRGLKNHPTGASSLGDMRYNDRWPDLTIAAIEKNHLDSVHALAALKRINRSALDPADALNYDLFEQEYKQDIEEFQFRHFLIPLNQRGGIQSADGLADRIPFQTKKHFADWILRLQNFSTYMDQTLALMQQGVNEGLVHPKIIMQRLPDQINAQIVSHAADSGFYQPFKNKPEAISQLEFDQLASEAQSAITDVVIPAFRKMGEFIEQVYLPACRDTAGVWDTPNGRAFYESQARGYTTTQLTPDQIHAIGLREVERIRAQMQTVMDGLHYQGSFAQFLNFLRTDPQFYHTSAEALLQDYRATSKRIDPELVKLFSDLPRIPYGVKPIPDAIAPDTTTAYYSSPSADGNRAGYYFVNLYRPEVRPKYEIEVLTVHEAMPGHHLQIALAQELGDLPNFRRYGGYTAFVEGWGLYSESLGDELGLYTDPYSKFGQLTYEMWRAVRLVVDTGLHYKEWTRQQAIDFFTANAAKAEYDIINEIDRYIAWPGQALAYKIGELKIKELRQRSENMLGENFDIKAFHKVVLGSGAVPLHILERNVDAWIAKSR